MCINSEIRMGTIRGNIVFMGYVVEYVSHESKTGHWAWVEEYKQGAGETESAE